MTSRLLLISAVVILGAVGVRAVGHGEPVPLTRPFWQFPVQLGAWDGRSVQLSEAIEKRAGVSSYMYRIFARREARSVPVHLYVGFYESQRHGEVIHSPNNCLPGSGWYIASRDKATIELPPYTPFEVNKFVIANGIERQVVLYWYQQGGGRVVTNEYAGRVHLVLDALQKNRTDAALIRVIVPAQDETDEALEAANAEAVDFLRAAYPELMRFLPHERPRQTS